MKHAKVRGVSKRGKSWVCTFALKDGTICRRVDPSALTAKQAAEQRAIWKQQVRLGQYEPKKPRPEPVKEVTVTAVWDAYEKDCQVRGVKAFDRQEFAWAHLKPVFADKLASDIKPKEIAEYVSARVTDGASNATVNREVAALRAALRLGARLEMIPSMPVFPQKLKEAQPRSGFVEEAQYKLLSKNASELWLRTFLALAFNFGFRKGELLNLRVSQVDLLNDWLTLDTSKNGSGRKVKLTAETKALLVECIRGKESDNFVLTHDGSQISQPRKNWYSLCCQSGLGKLDEDGHYQGLQMHDLRRSAVRRLVRRGVPEKICMAISGHKTRSVFDRYNITNERDLEQAAKLLEAPRQHSESESETDTKTDTSVFAHS